MQKSVWHSTRPLPRSARASAITASTSVVLEPPAAVLARGEDRADDHAGGVDHVVAVGGGAHAVGHHAAGQVAPLDAGRRPRPGPRRSPSRARHSTAPPPRRGGGAARAARLHAGGVCAPRLRLASASRNARRRSSSAAARARNSRPARKCRDGPGNESPSIEASATRAFAAQGPVGELDPEVHDGPGVERRIGAQEAADEAQVGDARRARRAGPRVSPAGPPGRDVLAARHGRRGPPGRRGSSGGILGPRARALKQRLSPAP